MENGNFIHYLDNNSQESKDSSEFIKLLGELTEKWTSGKINPDPDNSEFESLFNNLLTSAKQVHIEFIPYSKITMIVFKLTDRTGLDALGDALKARIKKDIDSKEADDIVSNEYLVLIKCVEHLNLANRQFTMLYQQQDKEISVAKDDLIKINQNIDELEDKSSSFEKLNEQYSKLTVDFVTILGIFTSITFATFGGLQLLGNVFGKVRSTDSASIGSELMLGAVFLFGTYMILIALLTGVSKLTNKDYKTSYPTRFLVVFSFFIIFMFGLIYSNVDYVGTVFTSHAGTWMLGAVVSIFVIGFVAWRMDACYRKKEKTK